MTHDPHAPTRRQWLAAATAGLLLPSLATAQNKPAAAAWPRKLVRIVVGFPAGSSPDLTARALAEPLAEAIGQSVIVENRPGASGNIGADVVAKADDDHTIGVIGNGPLASSPHLFAKLPYDPMRDLHPITLIGSSPLVLVASSALAFSSPAEFVKLLRDGGDRYNYGSVGVGSGTHLGMELIKSRTGIQAVHVPFNGAPAVVNALIGGQIQLAAITLGPALPQIQAGRIKAVAMTSSGRSSLNPGLPSLTEIGIPGLNVEVWNSVMAPRSASPAAMAVLTRELPRIVRSDAVRQKLFQQGWKVEGTAPEALALRLREESAMYAALIKRQGIRLDG